MSEFDEAIQQVKKVIISGGETIIEDWEIIMDQLVGSGDAETIQNIYYFVEKNFSFEIQKVLVRKWGDGFLKSGL